MKPVLKMACKQLSSEGFVPGIVMFTRIGMSLGPDILLAFNAACQCWILNLSSNAGSFGCFIIASNLGTGRLMVS